MNLRWAYLLLLRILSTSSMWITGEEMIFIRLYFDIHKSDKLYIEVRSIQHWMKKIIFTVNCEEFTSKIKSIKEF